MIFFFNCTSPPKKKKSVVWSVCVWPYNRCRPLNPSQDLLASPHNHLPHKRARTRTKKEKEKKRKEKKSLSTSSQEFVDLAANLYTKKKKKKQQKYSIFSCNNCQKINCSAKLLVTVTQFVTSTKFLVPVTRKHWVFLGDSHLLQVQIFLPPCTTGIIF